MDPSAPTGVRLMTICAEILTQIVSILLPIAHPAGLFEPSIILRLVTALSTASRGVIGNRFSI
jgi:hypothetical protein